MKYYKLKKDLPTFKAGDLFILQDDGNLWHSTGGRHVDVMAYAKKTLELFPNILKDWFEPAPEPLIKDEEIRKFIRDYFGIWGLKIGKGTKVKIEHFDFRTRIYCDTFEIVLPKIDELDICRSYTIEELYGEEEG